MTVTQQSRDEQLVLPMYRRFVFFDWFGTMSNSRFWEDITDTQSHPLAASLRDAVEELFTRKRELVRDWMVGAASDEEVVATLAVALPRNYRADYLSRRLLLACKFARIEPEMARLAAEVRKSAFVGIASDNMDCFVRAAPKILSGELSMDELLVSSQLGLLKKDDPGRFFGPTVARYGLEPSQAVLVDDCADTCAAFEEWGGTAVYFDSVTSSSQRLRNILMAP